MRRISILLLLKQTFWQWLGHNAQKLGASLAFYTTLSLAPMLVLAVAIAGFIFGEEAARGQVVWQIQDFIGREAATVVQDMLKNGDWRRSYSSWSVHLVFRGLRRFRRTARLA
jgi:membrane protein